MTTSISPAAVRSRDTHRETTGRFGAQPHVESNLFVWDNEFADGQEQFTSPWPEPAVNEWAEIDAYAASFTPIMSDVDDECRTTVVTG